jgi:hypothetical protein
MSARLSAFALPLPSTTVSPAGSSRTTHLGSEPAGAVAPLPPLGRAVVAVVTGPLVDDVVGRPVDDVLGGAAEVVVGRPLLGVSRVADVVDEVPEANEVGLDVAAAEVVGGAAVTEVPDAELVERPPDPRRLLKRPAARIPPGPPVPERVGSVNIAPACRRTSRLAAENGPPRA